MPRVIPLARTRGRRLNPPMPKLRMPFTRRSVWEITEDDLPKLFWRERDARLVGLEHNPAFRALRNGPTDRFGGLFADSAHSIVPLLIVASNMGIKAGSLAFLSGLFGYAVLFGSLLALLVPLRSVPKIGFQEDSLLRELFACGYPAEDIAKGIWGASLPRNKQTALLAQSIGVILLWLALVFTSRATRVDPWFGWLLTVYGGTLAFYWGAIARPPAACLAAVAIRVRQVRQAVDARSGRPLSELHWSTPLSANAPGFIAWGCLVAASSWSHPLPLLLLVAPICYCLGRAESYSWDSIPHDHWICLVEDLIWIGRSLQEPEPKIAPRWDPARGSGWFGIFGFRLRKPRYKGKYQGPMWKR